jgi:cell wall-associated NlpC family hydrolase
MSERIAGRMRTLAIVLVLMMTCATALADSIDVRLNASAKVYSSLDASARSVTVPKGLEVSLRACSKGWARVVYKGKTGYIRLKYLDRVNPLKAYVASSATVYKDASASKTLTTVSAGTLVYALGVEGGCVRITNGDRSWKGYIRSGLLTSAKPDSPKGGAVPGQLQATAEGAKASKIEKTIYAAQALVGTPYSEHPEPPKSFDCASYTAFCYGAAWKDILKGSVKGQGYDDRFSRVKEVSRLKRGDMVCFNTVDDKDLCDHVGIYLGKGYFLHASSVAKKVIVSQLKSGYYSRVFSWGVRVFS